METIAQHPDCRRYQSDSSMPVTGLLTTRNYPLFTESNRRDPRRRSNCFQIYTHADGIVVSSEASIHAVLQAISHSRQTAMPCADISRAANPKFGCCPYSIGYLGKTTYHTLPISVSGAERVLCLVFISSIQPEISTQCPQMSSRFQCDCD